MENDFFDFVIEDNKEDLIASLFPAQIDSYTIDRETNDLNSINLNEIDSLVHSIIGSSPTTEEISLPCRGKNLRSSVRKRNTSEEQTEVKVNKRHGRPPKPIDFHVEDLTCTFKEETSCEKMPHLIPIDPSESGTSHEKVLEKQTERNTPNYILGRRRNMPEIEHVKEEESEESRLEPPTKRSLLDKDPEGTTTIFLTNATKSHMQKYFMRKKKTPSNQKPEGVSEGTSEGIPEEESKPRRTIRRRKV